MAKLWNLGLCASTLVQQMLHPNPVLTMLCWACNSISRELTVRLNSMMSDWQDCSCSELDATCWFSSSVCNTHTGSNQEP